MYTRRGDQTSLPEENRQWELMKSIDEWMDVYVWEVDRTTIKYANSNARMVLRLVHLLFYGNLAKIEKFFSKSGRFITVGDVIRWATVQTSPKDNYRVSP